MLSNSTSRPKRRQSPFQRDENYWESLLATVESSEPDPMKSQPGQSLRPDLDLPQRDTFVSDDVWHDAAAMLAADEAVELEVSGFNKGGLLVTWRGLTGFVPASHLFDAPPYGREDIIMQLLRKRVGKLICVKLIEVAAENDRLIFSERAVQVDADTRQTLWDTIAPGMVMEGVITNLTDFGAFVDLGGVEGLIHISELSWSRLKHPSDIVDIGETIDAKVLQVDHERKRVALSYKMTRHDPWQDIETRYRPDQIVEGVIRDVAPYGVFVTLEDELEGLVHVSEFGDLGGANPLDSVERGQYIVVRVMNVNARNRRIALSLRGIVFSAE